MVDGKKSGLNIGIVSMRIAGTDGVSLEIAKWADVLERMGHHCYYICGESDRPEDRTFQIAHADFRHPDIAEIYWKAFGGRRTRELNARIRELTEALKNDLYQAFLQFRIDLVITENSLTIPLNLPLGIAQVELLQETGLPCIAHHHDFRWERPQYVITCVNDILHAAFPPPLPEIVHVVINSLAGREFSRRTGMPYRVVPNVMDFANPPAPPDDYALSFREAIGVGADDILMLQPTRVVARKGIEHTIELVRRLDDPRIKLAITHSKGDEGNDYADHITELARIMGVELLYVGDRVSSRRGEDAEGRRVFSVWDAYHSADIVSYPSTYEGFGNAFLEAVYYRKTVICNRYTIYRADIEPAGFQVIAMNEFVTDAMVREVRAILGDEAKRVAMAEHNYAVARERFSYEQLTRQLRSILNDPRCWVANPD